MIKSICDAMLQRYLVIKLKFRVEFSMWQITINDVYFNEKVKTLKIYFMIVLMHVFKVFF